MIPAARGAGACAPRTYCECYLLATRTEERTGEAVEFAGQLTAVGRKFLPGEAAPEFILEHCDVDAGALRQVGLAASAGQVCILDVIDSLDTPICRENTAHAALSARKDESFGCDYALLLKERRLLQRMVFAIDDAGRVAHAEYVADRTTEHDDDAAVTAARVAAAW